MSEFGDYISAQKIYLAIAAAVRKELDKIFPPARYATVTEINLDDKWAMVVYVGETDSVKVPFLNVAPTEVGQEVRIEGRTGDRYITAIRGTAKVQRDVEDASDAASAANDNAITATDMAGDAIDTAKNAETIANSVTVNATTNKPLWISLDPTADVSFPLEGTAYATGGTQSVQSITSTIARLTKIRITNSQVMNTVAFMVYRTGTVSAFYFDMYRFNRNTSIWELQFSSPDLSGQLTTTLQKIQEVFSVSGVPCESGELWAVHFRMGGSGTISFVSKTFPSTFIPGFVPQTIGASRNPTTTPAPATITDSVMNTINDGNVVFAEIGSNIGQVDLPRYWTANFNSASWNGWSRYHTGITGSDLTISSGRVTYNGGNDGAQFALYSNATATDHCVAQADILQGTGQGSSIGICVNNAGWNGVMLVAGVDTIWLFTINNSSYGTTQRASQSVGNGNADGHKFQLEYDPDDNTFRGYRLDGTTWTEVINWQDSGNVVKHGKGYRFGFISIQHAVFLSGGDIDNFALFDRE